jgi:hypothetical protein
VSQVPTVATGGAKKSSGIGAAIAAATGGALIAGPVGAGAGFLIGLLAAKKA